MRKYSLLLSILLFATAGIFNGCAPVKFQGFKSLELSSTEGQKNRVRFNKISNSDLTEIIKDGAFSLTRGEFSDIQTHTENGKEYYLAEYTVSYGDIMRPIGKVIPHLIPEACTAAGIPGSSTPFYRNEIPCGSLNHMNWKTIINVNLDQQWGWAGSYPYWIGAVNIPVMISRKNNQGWYNEPSLDSRSTESKLSSEIPGDDIAVRFKPKGNLLDMEFCVNVPGTQVTAQKSWVPASVEQDLWITKINLDASMEVNPGIVEFDFIRQCFNLETGFRADTGEPVFEVTQIGKAHVETARLNGTSLYFTNWFTSIVDFILQIFEVNVRQEIVRAAQNTVGDISKNDFDSGAWLVQVSQGTMGERFTREIGKNVEARIANRSLSTSTPEIRKVISQQCMRLAALTSINDVQRLTTEFCTHALDHVEVAVEPFAYDAEMDQLGCYEYFANVNKGHSGAWWTNQCKFKIRLAVGISLELKDRIEKIAQILNSLFDGIPDPFAIDLANIPEIKHINFQYLDAVIAHLQSQGQKEISLETIKAFVAQNPGAEAALFLQSILNQ